MEAIKRIVVFFFLFPLKLGLETTIRPFTWGFELTPAVISVYALAVATAVAFSARRWGWRAGAAIAALGSLLYFGIVNMPWPAFVAMVAVAAYSIGGARIAVFAVIGLAFMLIAGIWTPAIGSTLPLLGRRRGGPRARQRARHDRPRTTTRSPGCTTGRRHASDPAALRVPDTDSHVLPGGRVPGVPWPSPRTRSSHRYAIPSTGCETSRSSASRRRRRSAARRPRSSGRSDCRWRCPR